MAIAHDIVGLRSGGYERRWDDRDVLTYALGVGAGVDEPGARHAFTAENIPGAPLRVLPTFAVVPVQDAGGLRDRYGTFDRSQLVHAQQSVQLHQVLPAEGRVRAESTISGLYDKGSGALVETSTRAIDADTGEALFSTVSAVFIRGEGGWNGDRGLATTSPVPEREPDAVVAYATRPDQALLYRLSGDRNPLHSDPETARRGGFSRPILHGLCTFGFTGRALLSTLCDNDPAAFGSMSARFTSPVLPGDTLYVYIWFLDSGVAAFRTLTDRGVVMDHGFAETRQPAWREGRGRGSLVDVLGQGRPDSIRE